MLKSQVVVSIQEISIKCIYFSSPRFDLPVIFGEEWAVIFFLARKAIGLEVNAEESKNKVFYVQWK
jgi:hypothetical protein